MPGRIARTFNRIGGSLMARTGRIGILTATGARSGAKRSVPLGYVKRPDGTLLIGAGSQEPRGWVANLTADPVVTFAIKGATVRYRAGPRARRRTRRRPGRAAQLDGPRGRARPVGRPVRAGARGLIATGTAASLPPGPGPIIGRPAISAPEVRMQTVVHARSQVAEGVLAIGPEPVRLTWQVTGAEPGATQLACGSGRQGTRVRGRAVHRRGGGRCPDRGRGARRTAGQPRGALAPGAHPDGGRLEWLVGGRAGGGGAPGPIRLDRRGRHAARRPGSREQAASPVVRRAFTVTGSVRSARLYVTSLGVHDVVINGTRVGEDILAPGWTTYRHRLITETHDVTDLLVAGENAIAATLGDGWYRGRLGWDAIAGNDRRRYGDGAGVHRPAGGHARGRVAGR